MTIKKNKKGHHIDECWQAIYGIMRKEIYQERKKIYTDLMKIADDNEEEFMRKEIIRYFSKQ